MLSLRLSVLSSLFERVPSALRGILPQANALLMHLNFEVLHCSLLNHHRSLLYHHYHIDRMSSICLYDPRHRHRKPSDVETCQLPIAPFRYQTGNDVLSLVDSHESRTCKATSFIQSPFLMAWFNEPARLFGLCNVVRAKSNTSKGRFRLVGH